MKTKINSDRILSITAFIISIATLIALMYQSNLVSDQNKMMQKEQYASVMPYLSMGFMGNEEDSSFDLFLSNDGVGPAFIKEINIRYNDSLYQMSIIDFYSNILKVENSNNVKILRTDIGTSTVIPANRKIPLLTFYTDQDEAVKLLGAFGTMDATIEITYASIYDQKWILKNIMESHIPVE
jgi:hypothetical protein